MPDFITLIQLIHPIQGKIEFDNRTKRNHPLHGLARAWRGERRQIFFSPRYSQKWLDRWIGWIRPIKSGVFGWIRSPADPPSDGSAPIVVSGPSRMIPALESHPRVSVRAAACTRFAFLRARPVQLPPCDAERPDPRDKVLLTRYYHFLIWFTASPRASAWIVSGHECPRGMRP